MHVLIKVKTFQFRKVKNDQDWSLQNNKRIFTFIILKLNFSVNLSS